MESKMNRFFLFFIPLVAFLVYANTLSNEIALDDELYILKNPAIVEMGVGEGVKTAFANDALFWIDLPSNTAVYRPLMISSFIIENAFFKNIKSTGFTTFKISHWINILFYMGGCLMLFLFLRSLLAYKNITVFWAGAMAVLYTVHPIHTEVVANIKSRDELMALVFGMAALWAFVKYVDAKELKYLAIALVAYLIALFAKESAVTLLGVFPLIYWLKEGAVSKLGKIVMLTLPFAAVVGFFLIVRANAMPDTEKAYEVVDNFLVFEKQQGNYGNYYGTAMKVLLYYVKLLFIPNPLTWDYSLAQIKTVGLVHGLSLLSIVLHVGLLAYGLYAMFKKKLIGFGILFYLMTISLTSNILITIGSVMAERFVFVPSIGFVIIIGLLIKYAVDKFIKSEKAKLIVPSVFIGAIAVVFSVLTFQQNKLWKNNETLFIHGAKVSSNSTRTQGGAGNVYVQKAQATKDEAEKSTFLEKAKYHYSRAIEIHDKNVNAHLGMGNAHFYAKDYPSAKTYYEKTLALNPGNNNALDNLERVADILFTQQKLKEAEAITSLIADYRPNSKKVIEQKAKYLFVQGKMVEAIPLLQALVKADPNNTFYKEKLAAAEKYAKQLK